MTPTRDQIHAAEAAVEDALAEDGSSTYLAPALVRLVLDALAAHVIPDEPVQLLDGHRVTAQTLAWEAEHGIVPANRGVVVTCGEPRCVAHLALVQRRGRRTWSPMASGVLAEDELL